MMRTDWCWLVAACGVVLCALAATACGLVRADEAVLSFNRDIRPILSEKCFHCHGPAEDSREADLRLDVRDDAVDYGAIVPGDADSSVIIERVESDDAELVMPPPEAKRTLTADQKATLRRWVESGAEYAKHWSFEPPSKKLSAPLPDTDWPRSAVDHFILKALRDAGLKPNAESDRTVWLRRVTFDLTGLPPTHDDIDAFRGNESDDAYERVVDRLLASKAHAERLATEWLDIARYSDTFGYQRDDERLVWPYRDWVIEAFARNQSYDEFVTWQLAGDLLPNATREQRLATTFCRLHSHKKEGGVAVEEFRVENVADRTHTFSSAFLGLTVECARCHDHKYDPITAKEYYQLSSFFANIDERGLISYFTDATPTPAMPLPTSDQEAELAEAQHGVELAERELAGAEAAASGRFIAWLQSSGSFDGEITGLVARVDFDQKVTDPPAELLFEEDTGFVEANSKPLDASRVVAFTNTVDPAIPAITNDANRLVEGVRGEAIELTGDDSVVIPGVGHIERHEPLSVSLWVRPAEVEERGVIYRRSGGWDDSGSMGYALIQRGAKLRANFVHFWPGNAIAVETDAVLRPGEWRHVTVTYDGSSAASGIRIYVDGVDTNARVIQDRLTRTINNWRGGYLDLAIGSRYRDRGFKDGAVDDFCVYDRELTPLEARHGYDGEALKLAVAPAPSGEVADARRSELQTYFLATADTATQEARRRLRAAQERWNSAMDATPAITIMREQAEPRPAYVLDRGAYDAHGEPVTANTPGVLPPFPEGQPTNRLGLARWLFDPDHPLTARVTVNRYWQMLFGTGLVKTPEDFGSQGAPPSHPELLDWLAGDFVDSGWDVRRLLRTLVLSSTYRQSSVVDPAVRDQDPENVWLGRGATKPLSAEMLRDNALAVSGLLKQQVGGPPVKPYDLSLAYTPVENDSGEALYRRSLYTFWKRTSPSPVMMTMNANRREVCQLKRENTMSPLQALVLLNGTQFVEASRAYAERLLAKHNDNAEGLAKEAFMSLTSRKPTPKEIVVLNSIHADQLAEFREHPQLADDLLGIGAVPLSGEIDPIEHAAATIVVNAIMNLDESVRCR